MRRTAGEDFYFSKELVFFFLDFDPGSVETTGLHYLNSFTY